MILGEGEIVEGAKLDIKARHDKPIVVFKVTNEDELVVEMEFGLVEAKDLLQVLKVEIKKIEDRKLEDLFRFAKEKKL